MDWMACLATAIAVLRLGLICGGMWLLLRFSTRPGLHLDYQRKCFTIAGVIYLLGLLPQSLLLSLMNTDWLNFVLDSGVLCFVQNIACRTAAALHSAVFLNWMLEILLFKYTKKDDFFTTLIKGKCIRYFLILYTITFAMIRNAFLQPEYGEIFFTDVASKSDVDDFQWTVSTVKNPSQVVRLQLLLCENSLCENQTGNFLFTSYTFVLLPLLLLCIPRLSDFRNALACHFFVQKRSSFVAVKDSEDSCDTVDEQLQQDRVWWEQEINIQRCLSASITIWFHLLQPIIFSLHREHFVDFGTHLLLTICVFIPWTHSQKEYNPLQSWV